MRYEKQVKGLILGLVVSVLAACSSNQPATDDGTTGHWGEQTSDSSNSNSGSTLGGSGGMDGADVELGSVEQLLTPEEQQQAMMQELRESQVIYFDFDQSEIRSEFIDILDAHASFLRDNPSVSVLIEGHTDERGTPEYNIALGEKRAKAVAYYLQSLGVLSTQISAVSYGEEKPVDMTHTISAMAENRRAVLVY